MNPKEFHEARRFEFTPFGKIAYVERGTGPAVLFLQGYPLNGFQWRGVLDDLDREHRCIAPDLMGLGYSEIPAEQDLSFAAQVRMLAAFLDGLGVERVHLVGSDSGGGIGQVFVAAYPSRVSSLTLLNCEVHDKWPNDMAKNFFELVKSRAIVQGFKLILQDQTAAHAQLNGIYEDVKQAATPETIKVYFEPLVATEIRGDQACRFAELDVNRPQLIAAAPQLRKLTTPVQLIWGDADTVFDMQPSFDWLKANLARIERTTIVPRGKLYFVEEHPRLVSTLLREFWSSIEASQSASSDAQTELRPSP